MTEHLRKLDADCIMRQTDNKELVKQAIKEAAKEWLDEQFRNFGKWTAGGLVVGVFYGAVKLLVINGWWPK